MKYLGALLREDEMYIPFLDGLGEKYLPSRTLKMCACTEYYGGLNLVHLDF